MSGGHSRNAFDGGSAGGDRPSRDVDARDHAHRAPPGRLRGPRAGAVRRAALSDLGAGRPPRLRAVGAGRGGSTGVRRAHPGRGPRRAARGHPARRTARLRSPERAHLRAVALPSPAGLVTPDRGRGGAPGGGGQVRPEGSRKARLQPHELRDRRPAPHRAGLGVAGAVGERRLPRLPARLPRRPGGEPGRAGRPDRGLSRGLRGAAVRTLGLARGADGHPAAPAAERRLADLRLLHDLRPAHHSRLPRGTGPLCRPRRRGRGLRPVRPVPHQRAPLVAGRVLPARPGPRPGASGGAPPVDGGAPEEVGMKRILLLTAVLVCLPGPRVIAFRDLYVAKTNTKLFNQASQVALVRDGDQTVLTMANDFQGDPKEFALVVPVPTFIERRQIEVVDKALLDHLDAYTAPRLVEYFDEDPCRPRHLEESVIFRAAPAGVGAGKRKDLGVTVEATYTVGECDILILSARESTGLATWLVENGQPMPTS